MVLDDTTLNEAEEEGETSYCILLVGYHYECFTINTPERNEKMKTLLLLVLF